ncbi:MAG: peptide deformylase [Thalassobaculales bacterium]
MAALPILRMGHPVLRRKAEPVADPGAPEIHALVADMLDSMQAAMGVGLAAPQIGVSRRVVIFMVPAARVTDDPADSALPLTVLVNPEVEPVGEEVALAWEGCLSVPGMRGAVPRPARVRYRGVGLDGVAVERVVGGFHARVVQHEVDHLDGILYPQRMTDMTLFGFTEEMAALGATAPTRPELDIAED